MKNKPPMSKWFEAFRHEYDDALPEARKFVIDSPTKCAEAIAFRESVNALGKELSAETDLMLTALTEAAQILGKKIDEYRKPQLVKPKKLTKKDIAEFDL